MTSSDTADSLEDLYRVCVKIYAQDAPKAEDDAEVFVPIFHEWIRDGALDVVLLDVADYAHAPDSPGIMLIAHEASFALDRADGRFGLLAQRRTPLTGGAVEAIRKTLAQAKEVAEMLSRDGRVAGKLSFDHSVIRVEANDRMRAPNTDYGFAAFQAPVRAAVESVYGVSEARVSRVENDPRDRLAVDVRVGA